MAKQTRVAVIGAGISGLVAIKEALAAGFDVVGFDARPEVGGAWAYQDCALDDQPDAVWSSMYQGTMLNSCRDTSSFSDFPFDPARYPDYFKHTLMLQYLNEYADHFGLRAHIRLRTTVLECVPQEDGTWAVRTQQEGVSESETALFDAVFACSGHLSSPMIPDFPGLKDFQGQFLHSHCYRTPAPFEGKKVAIIGFGSSAVDIACEIAPQAKELHLITRRGGWVLPRYILGKPTEALDNRATQLWIPSKVSQWLQTKLLNIVDIPSPPSLVPSHRLLEQSPTLRGDFKEKVATGLITIQRATVSTFTPTGLSLTPSLPTTTTPPPTTIDADVIIAATGYNLTLPYVPPSTLTSPQTPPNSVALYKLLLPAHHRNLFLLGFAETIGPLPPAAEAQARHTVALLSGRIPTPSQDEITRGIAAFHAHQAKSFVHSPRHALVTHMIAYTDGLLEPLGAAPTFGRLLGRVFTSGQPWRALKVLSAVWFGIPASAQWRLVGEGSAVELAEETVLRIASGKGELSLGERRALGLV
ncbi:flavin-binding monooxygenase-like family protein [Podospora appendiculata]|uniref:Flavin-containing monooxygenase 1 n=1 Tax=Podospora appendiculata TaxID=314037 RepID=A0AAE0WZ16_9PEZI|nr:flavin-binding monooxygenase-like family protein [Podospora appendiculata]